MSPAAAEPRRRGHRSDAHRNDEHILRTAARVLADDPNATIQRIADEAGVVRMTVYRRYRNRDALRRAIFDRAAVEAHRVIADAHDRELDPLAALRALIVEMAAIIQRYPVLAVSTEWQPLPDDPYRPTTPPAARRCTSSSGLLAVFGPIPRCLVPTLLTCFSTASSRPTTRHESLASARWVHSCEGQ